MEEGQGRLTVFGATLKEVMGRRGIRTWTELSSRLEKCGFNYTAPRISNWAYGRHPVERSFGGALLRTLDLNAEERKILAEAFVTGQDTPVIDIEPEPEEARGFMQGGRFAGLALVALGAVVPETLPLDLGMLFSLGLGLV